MTQLLDNIDRIVFPAKREGLSEVLDSIYDLASAHLTDEEKGLFRYDLDFFYHQEGRRLVHNTFAGGIIFLREPETINGIDIEFSSHMNEVLASVEYASANRNARNVKYKPKAGKTESTVWQMPGLFPNFKHYPDHLRVILMAVIGKLTKHICEGYRKDSWFMQFDKPFDIVLFLDGKLELTYNVEVKQKDQKTSPED